MPLLLLGLACLVSGVVLGIGFYINNKHSTDPLQEHQQRVSSTTTTNVLSLAQEPVIQTDNPIAKTTAKPESATHLTKPSTVLSDHDQLTLPNDVLLTSDDEQATIKSLLENSSRKELLQITALAAVSDQERRVLITQTLKQYGMEINDANQIAVTAPQQGSLLGLLGIQHGALISSVNGKKPDQLLNDPLVLFKALTAEQVVLKYTQDGQDKVLSVPLSGL